jgi:hypothetical protein
MNRVEQYEAGSKFDSLLIISNVSISQIGRSVLGIA